jgi:hypothetical protein
MTITPGDVNAWEANMDRAYSFVPDKADWVEKAACRGIVRTAPTMYKKAWPDETVPYPQHGVERERFRDAYCTRCPVKRECLKFGLDSNSNGVWGGEFL